MFNGKKLQRLEDELIVLKVELAKLRIFVESKEGGFDRRKLARSAYSRKKQSNAMKAAWKAKKEGR